MHDVKSQLVDKAIEKDNFELSANIHQASPKLTLHPSITIARDPGSGGQPIAKLVAKKLNFEYYDDALVEEIAKSINKRKAIIKKIDEKTRTAIQDIVHSFLNPEYVSDLTYINHLTSTILGLLHKGKVVILGRGANFIVPDTDCLNVLVTAPKNVRVDRAITYEHHTKNKAKEIVEEITKERKEFVSQYFGKSYSRPNYYDLVLNTKFFDVKASSDIIIAAFFKKFPRFENFS